MVGIYFSGTGNSKFCLEYFLQQYDKEAKAFSIEEENAVEKIKQQEEIIFSYPVQYSNIPKILKDFINQNHEVWKGKKVFVIATMGLFSGDGAGILARLLQKYGAEIIGGLHLRMPDSISDEKALKHSLEKNKKLIKNAKIKIEQAATNMKNESAPQEGIGVFYHLAGLFGQRLYFRNKTKNYTDKLKIDAHKCIGCGKCVSLCPMKNITINNTVAISGDQCTMCYRCVNHCPKQAITLLGTRVVEQIVVEKYLKRVVKIQKLLMWEKK